MYPLLNIKQLIIYKYNFFKYKILKLILIYFGITDFNLNFAIELFINHEYIQKISANVSQIACFTKKKHMERKKYIYNPKSLSYDEIKLSWKDRIIKTAGISVAIIFTSALLLLASSNFITTPKEKKLSDKLNKANYNLEAISSNLTTLTKQIDIIQERDANVHRVILGIDPLDQSLWNSGTGGYKKYKSIINFDNTKELVRETIDKVEKLKRKVELQNASLDTLEKLAIAHADRLASIPSIKPIQEDKLKRKISYLSGFGYRDHPIYHIKKFHKGIDFTSPRGTPIQVTGNGVVKSIIIKKTGYGKHVLIDHGYGYETMYAHMSKINVKKGEKVVRGQIIGLVGSTGSSTAPHLHYEVRYKGKAINPIDFVYDGMSTEEYSEFVTKVQAENQSLD